MTDRGPRARSFRLGFWLGLLFGAAAALLLASADGVTPRPNAGPERAVGEGSDPRQPVPAPLPRQDGAPL